MLAMAAAPSANGAAATLPAAIAAILIAANTCLARWLSRSPSSTTAAGGGTGPTSSSARDGETEDIVPVASRRRSREAVRRQLVGDVHQREGDRALVEQDERLRLLPRDERGVSGPGRADNPRAVLGEEDLMAIEQRSDTDVLDLDPGLPGQCDRSGSFPLQRGHAMPQQEGKTLVTMPGGIMVPLAAGDRAMGEVAARPGRSVVVHVVSFLFRCLKG